MLHQLHQENEIPGRAEETPHVSAWAVRSWLWLSCWEEPEEGGWAGPWCGWTGVVEPWDVCARCPSPVPALSLCRNGYQKFSQELLSNGELNHLPLKERMVEIGSRWQRISQGQKDHYKKLAEEQQKQYKVHLDIWLKVGAGSWWEIPRFWD